MATRDHLAGELRRGQVCRGECPSRAVLVALTGKWAVLILIVLRDGTMRFADLHRTVSGVSERMLAKSLRQLERHRLLVRRSFPVVPPRVDYTLTPLGHAAALHLASLTDWIEENVEALVAPAPTGEA